MVIGGLETQGVFSQYSALGPQGLNRYNIKAASQQAIPMFYIGIWRQGEQ